MSLVTPVGYHTKWNMADSELPTVSFVCSYEVCVQLLQHCMLLYDTCANNSINSDKRNRPHSYSVQQQSPVSAQWACELVQQEQKIPHPSTKCHYMTWWMCGVLWVQRRLLGQCLISWDYTFTPMLYIVTFFITSDNRTQVIFCNSTLNRNGGSPFNFCY